MSRIKNSALWMMMALVLWTMGPGAACLVPARGSAQHACCRMMARHCDQAMRSDGSCCNMERNQTASEPGAVFSVERGHEFDALLASAMPQRDAVTTATGHAISSPRPLDTSPGRSSILRI